MKAFTKILVPVDFSPHSSEAIRAAADLSKRYDASVVLVHVLEPVSYVLPDGYTLYTATQMANLLTELGKQLSGAKAEAEAAGALRVTTSQLQGVIASEILDYAKQNACDLIVMGTHGRKGFAHAVIGSIAERVLRSAPCPVLTVKAEA